MKLFIDTANVEHIREVSQLGVVCGVTTNPTLIAKEGRDLREVILEIASIIDGPISGEVVSLECAKIVEEAKALSLIHKNVVVKIPMCTEGLKATSIVSKMGIKTNLTLIFSASQALLAARAGATYVSPFIGRLDDIGHNGIELIKEISDIFSIHGIKTEIIAASIRSQAHITQAALSGSHIATIPYKVLLSCITHPMTQIGIEQFVKDWESVEEIQKGL